MNGDSAFNSDREAAAFYTLTIHMGGETITTKASAKETILVTIEKAGLFLSYQRYGIGGAAF